MKEYKVYKLGTASEPESTEQEITRCLSCLNLWRTRNPRLISTHADGNVVYGVFECDL